MDFPGSVVSGQLSATRRSAFVALRGFSLRKGRQAGVSLVMDAISMKSFHHMMLGFGFLWAW